jgi:hypothetical protein
MFCRNPSFGLATKAKGGCKVAGQEEGSPGVKAKALQKCGPRGSPRAKARGSPRVKAKASSGVKARESPGVTSHSRECKKV